jgi:hypothetical protein
VNDATYMRQRSPPSFQGRRHSWHAIARTWLVTRSAIKGSFVRSLFMQRVSTAEPAAPHRGRSGLSWPFAQATLVGDLAACLLDHCGSRRSATDVICRPVHALERLSVTLATVNPT